MGKKRDCALRGAVGRLRAGPIATTLRVSLLAVSVPALVTAMPCAVPAARQTIAAAVADSACTEIILAAQTFSEEITIARDLIVRGASAATTTIEGRVSVSGARTDVVLAALTIDASTPSTSGCYGEALLVEGANVEVENVQVRNSSASSACALFSDGFESGGTGQWSSTIP